MITGIFIGFVVGVIVGFGIFAIISANRTSLFWVLKIECEGLIRELRMGITPAITDPSIERMKKIIDQINDK